MEKDIETGKIDTTTEKTSSSSPERLSSKDGGFIELPRSETKLGRFVDSFKRNPNARVTTEAVDAEGRPLENAEPKEPALAMELKNRYVL